MEHQIYHFYEFRFHLIRSAENMGIVLGEATHARESMKLSALLISVRSSKLGKPDGQVAIRAGFHFVYLTVVRTVHRLKQKLLPFIRSMNGLERILPVFF